MNKLSKLEDVCLLRDKKGNNVLLFCFEDRDDIALSFDYSKEKSYHRFVDVTTKKVYARTYKSLKRKIASLTGLSAEGGSRLSCKIMSRLKLAI